MIHLNYYDKKVLNDNHFSQVTNSKAVEISGNNLCKELLAIGPESEFAPSERHRLGFGTYKYIGYSKLGYGEGGDPVYMLTKNTTSRIGLITRRYRGGYKTWIGWVSNFY